MAETLVRVLVLFDERRGQVIRPDVESESSFNFCANMGWNTTSTTSGGEGVCDPCRVVMWFVGGGRFPRLPAPFQGALEFGHLRAEGQEEQRRKTNGDWIQVSGA
jgi:hypothetical protein